MSNELHLIANGWRQLPRGRWTHQIFTYGDRCRSFTIDAAIEQDAKLLPPKPATAKAEQ